MTAKSIILDRLSDGNWYAIHELHIQGYSENCIASRLPELALAGLVQSRFREGKSFKEWRILPAGTGHAAVSTDATKLKKEITPKVPASNFTCDQSGQFKFAI